jgi:two-component system nitrogen regulation response regulator GlnG
MPASLQTRLLRVLAEGEFFRVGGRELIRVDVRVIAATHQDLEALVQQGRFRADLLHRLNVVRLQIPPLRERRSDIPPLADTFLHRAARKLGAGAKRFEPAALAALQAMDWPGNVRELQNLCWRLAALAPGETITLADLDDVQAPTSGTALASTPSAPAEWDRQLGQWALACLQAGARELHAEARDRFDQALLNAALQHTGGRRVEAAALLGVGRNTVTRKLGPGRKRR